MCLDNELMFEKQKRALSHLKIVFHIMLLSLFGAFFQFIGSVRVSLGAHRELVFISVSEDISQVHTCGPTLNQGLLWMPRWVMGALGSSSSEHPGPCPSPLRRLRAAGCKMCLQWVGAWRRGMNHEDEMHRFIHLLKAGAKETKLNQTPETLLAQSLSINQQGYKEQNQS